MRHRPWHRWYVIEGHPATTAGGTIVDPDEYIVATFATRRAAARWMHRSGDGHGIISHHDWHGEH